MHLDDIVDDVRPYPPTGKVMEIKERFKQSMRFIYPNGVEGPAQWRDLIRVYMMGWFDVLMENELLDVGKRHIPQYEEISQVGWWPDDSWKWWE